MVESRASKSHIFWLSVALEDVNSIVDAGLISIVTLSVKVVQLKLPKVVTPIVYDSVVVNIVVGVPVKDKVPLTGT